MRRWSHVPGWLCLALLAALALAGGPAGRQTPQRPRLIFRLTRPQPSLLPLLASGYAAVPLAALRQRCNHGRMREAWLDK